MEDRVRKLNDAPFRENAKYILYWTQMNRRVSSNHALAFAADLANERKIPLLVYEGVTCSYPFANDRLHTFLLEGVPETERHLGKLGIGYVFYLRRRKSDPNDVLYRLARDASAVATDDYPVFIARNHNASVPEKLDIPYFAVDSSCVVPMNRIAKREYAAYTIRPKIHRLLPAYLKPAPPVAVRRGFEDPPREFHVQVTDQNIPDLVASSQIDHSVKPSLSFHGGRVFAKKHLDHFLRDNLSRYANHRNEPAGHATSDLSPYLHFGAISSLEVALEAMKYADERKLIAGEFLEELIVRRELAFNFARHTDDLESFSSLPDWAKNTMAKHARDRREFTYTRDEFESAKTHDALWNATQKEMLLRGKIHGYYRMYWGKKIIEWSESYEDALKTMIHMHDRYALDGRDPNTYANILWCFGLHDRPWPERPVFGMIRFMSHDGMKRKTNVEAYLREIRAMEETGWDPFRLTRGWR